MNYGQGPGYGYPQRPPPKQGWARWGGLVVAVVICLGVAVRVGMTRAAEANGSAPDATSTAGKAAKAPQEKTYTPATAGQLIADYEGNEIRGDNAWKNVDVEVVGIVQSITKGPLGGLYVVLSDSKEVSLHTVHINLKTSESGRAASLNKGESATFRGRVQGYVLGSVSVRDAVLIN